MLMANDLRRSLDPVQLMLDGGVEPDRWQADLLRTQPKRTLCLCSRQSGKTEVAVTMAEWVALYQPGSLTLIVSPSQRQSAEVFRRLMLLHSKLKDVSQLTAESALRAEYANGSRVLALPGSEKTTRGYAGANLVIVDEAARCDDSLMSSLRPSMATVDGSLIALSTPFGKRGWFFEAWSNGAGWYRVKVPASECPRLSEEFLADELAQLGRQQFKQEYELEFVDDAELIFPVELIDKAFSDDLRAIW